MKKSPYTIFYRNLVTGVDYKIPLPKGGYVTPINFDNAATTPPFVSVMRDINAFSPWYSSIHRGTGYKSQYSSFIYEASRKIVLDFVGGKDNSEVVYVKNTTEAINIVAHQMKNQKEDIILSTCMEHHSNDLPWRNGMKVDYVNIDEDGRLDISHLKDKLIRYNGKVKLVAITGASNVTGIINPIHKIASICHQHNAKILVDGAQLVPHCKVSIHPCEANKAIDFITFSGHKMYAPFGSGVLVAPKDFFLPPPHNRGGGAVDIVTHEYVKWSALPSLEEAGTPNIMGVVALISAINTIKALGIDNITAHEANLMKYIIEELKMLDDVILYGDTKNLDNNVSIITFNIKDIYHDITAKILSYEDGIAVRSGCFCAHPYVQRLLKISNEELLERIDNPHLPKPGMVRVSLGLYNTQEEAYRFIRLIKKIVKNKSYYCNLYQEANDLYFPLFRNK